MGQVNILKIKRLITTVSWHAVFFYPISFFGLHLDFQLLKHICCTRGNVGLRCESNSRGRVSVLILVPSMPQSCQRGSPANCSDGCAGPAEPLLDMTWRLWSTVARDYRCFPRLPRAWKAKWFRPCYTENQTSPVYRGQASTFTPRFHDAYPK